VGLRFGSPLDFTGATCPEEKPHRGQR
jgi:hypothetical protein